MQRMMKTKSIIKQIGPKKIAAAVGVGITAVGNASSSGAFPASWAVVLRGLAQEHGLEVPDDLFTFKRSALSNCEHAAKIGEAQGNGVSHG